MKHSKVSGIANGTDATLVQPSDWNDVHYYGITAVSANTTLGSTHDCIEATAGAADITITLPPLASVVAGRPYEIMKVDAGAGRVLVVGNAAELIRGQNQYSLVNQWQYVKLVANNAKTAWLVYGGN